jgi:hypothetical protein
MSVFRWLTGFSAAVLVFVCAPHLRAERPDLSGTWVLDTSASTFSANPPTGGTLTIRKQGKTLHIAEAFTMSNGDKSREYDWKVDDTFHPVGAGEGEVLAKWDHDSLVGQRRTGDGQNMETVRMTARDANSMTETIVRPDGQSALVWRRQ